MITILIKIESYDYKYINCNSILDINFVLSELNLDVRD